MRTSWRLAGVAFVAALGLMLATASGAWGDDSVTPLCNSQPCGAGWYGGPVFLSWAWSNGTATSGCSNQDYTANFNQFVECDVTFSDGSGSIDRQYRLKVEVSSPVATAAFARAADSNGWYNHPVAISFSGSSFSGIASCSPVATYSGPSGTSLPVGGSCTDNAGKVANTSVALNYDAAPPTVTGWSPSRPPDFNGWYNHPVSFTFTGGDSVSGIDSCSTVTYAGPDSGAATVLGSCRDRAGNVATLPVPLQYNSTPPSLQASATTGDEDVTVNWQTSAELSALTITRSPGVHGDKDSVVAQGGADGTFNDTRVRNGVRYRYTITAVDQAGNVATRVLTATPDRRVLFPVGGVQVASPPVLAWTPVRHASYYNVQLYRDGRKVLSIWPSHAELGLKRSWKFDHHRFFLKPGFYRWYAWPGFGARRAGRYGRRIGTGTFVVT